MTSNQKPGLFSNLPRGNVRSLTLAGLYALFWICLASFGLVIAFGFFKLLYLVVRYILVFTF